MKDKKLEEMAEKLRKQIAEIVGEDKLEAVMVVCLESLQELVKRNGSLMK